MDVFYFVSAVAKKGERVDGRDGRTDGHRKRMDVRTDTKKKGLTLMDGNVTLRRNRMLMKFSVDHDQADFQVN